MGNINQIHMDLFGRNTKITEGLTKALESRWGFSDGSCDYERFKGGCLRHPSMEILIPW